MTTDIAVGMRWDPALQQEIIEEYDYDGGNSSSRLFERSRIKALAGNTTSYITIYSFNGVFLLIFGKKEEFVLF